jgi:hypothetical protein
MSVSRRVLLALAVSSLVLPAYAAETPKPLPAPPGNEAAPEAIVKTLYDAYRIDQNYDYLGEKLRPRYFTATTADLIKRVFVKSETDNEPGIDYEPLIDGQEGEVKDLNVVVTSNVPPKATVEARFMSFGDKMTVIFDFVQETGVWKIDDIRNKEGNSLKAVAKDFLQ